MHVFVFLWMDKKLIIRIIKVIVVILIILSLLYFISWYLEKEGFIQKNIFKDFPIIGYTGYGFDDPCSHEPGTPDPCGGS
jgi:hypothetical protein